MAHPFGTFLVVVLPQTYLLDTPAQPQDKRFKRCYSYTMKALFFSRYAHSNMCDSLRSDRGPSTLTSLGHRWAQRDGARDHPFLRRGRSVRRKVYGPPQSRATRVTAVVETSATGEVCGTDVSRVRTYRVGGLSERCRSGREGAKTLVQWTF